jgi:hypothetical protein
VYDLVLSYKGTTQVYKGVLTVGDATGHTKFPEITTDHPFSFGYEPFLSGTITTGDELTLEAWVVNNGEHFKINGDFRPQATLCYKGKTVSYTIQGKLVKMGVSSTITYVESGATGRGSYAFDIPEDAPAGEYDLVLSYGNAEQTFENVLTVKISDSTDPLSSDQLIQAAQNLLSLLTPYEADAYGYVIAGNSCVITQKTAAVKFYLHLGDVRTEQSIEITLSTEGVYQSHTVRSPEYAVFLSLVTPEMIADAKTELYDKLDGGGHSSKLFFTMNSDEDLVLYYEDFVYNENLGAMAPRNVSVTVCPAPAFSLTVELPDGVTLSQPLKDSYRMSDNVYIHLSGMADTGYVGYINGKPALVPRSAQIKFTMPAEDTVITVKEFSVPSEYSQYAPLIATYMVDNGVSTAEILHFYESRRGFVAVMMSSDEMNYQKEPWHEFILNAEFRYADSNRVLIYYARQFYTLQEAVDEKILDTDSAIILVRKHKELFPENYARS